MPAVLLQRVGSPQQRDPTPWQTVPRGREQAPGDAALVTAGVSQVWGDPTAGSNTQYSRVLQPYNNTSTKPRAKEGLQGTWTPQGGTGQPRTAKAEQAAQQNTEAQMQGQSVNITI